MTVSKPTTNSNSSTESSVQQLSLKLRFNRQCRLWHGYLSAFAFAALLFFSATGVVLNHPNWFATNKPPSSPIKLTLNSSQLQDLRNSPTPAEMLMKIVADQTTLYGEYKDGATAMDQVFVRLRGARGSSDIRANLKDGIVVVTVERATTIGLFNALHRGESTGAAWRIFIDVVGGVLIVLSLVGYAIFFSMSARLKTALLITGVSVIGFVLFFVVMVR
jgi:hypothetical protein